MASRSDKLMGKVAQVAELLPDDKKHLIEEFKPTLLQVFRIEDFITIPGHPGYKCIPPLNAEGALYAHNHWTPHKGDVIISSFPKTGTTWTREIVRQLLYKDDESQYEKSKKLELPFIGYIEAGNKAKYEMVEAVGLERNVWGTHMDTELINAERLLKSGAKVIYVMRNPKDAAISLKKFLKDMPWMKGEMAKRFPTELNDFIQKFIDGELPLFGKEGDGYLQHIRHWMKYKNHPNFLPMFYERLKMDPHKEIKKIAKFIDVSISENEANEVVRKTSFDTMKDKAKETDTGHGPRMFRKGGVGNWKSHFNVAQSELMDAAIRKQIGDLDIDFIYSLPRTGTQF